MGTNDAVNKCSGAYGGGEVAGIGYGFVAGGAVGFRAAALKGERVAEIRLGSFKSEAKWANQLEKRGWTKEKIADAVARGKRFPADNLVNKGNSATRYVHPETGQSVVIDDVTKEIIHVGGPGFKY